MISQIIEKARQIYPFNEKQGAPQPAVTAENSRLSGRERLLSGFLFSFEETSDNCRKDNHFRSIGGKDSENVENAHDSTTTVSKAFSHTRIVSEATTLARFFFETRTLAAFAMGFSVSKAGRPSASEGISSGRSPWNEEPSPSPPSGISPRNSMEPAVKGGGNPASEAACHQL